MRDTLGTSGPRVFACPGVAVDPYGTQWKKLRHEAKAVYPPTCHLCLQPIDLTLSGRHPEGWTLDHLDPVADVGAGVPHISRVRPAHKKCNESRGRRPVTTRPRSRVW